MNEQVKVKIAMAGLDALFTHGLPAMAKMINILNDKEKVTLEDIEQLKGDLDAEDYFK